MITKPIMAHESWVIHDLKSKMGEKFELNQASEAHIRIIEYNFSALKFVLQELSEMALRYVSRDLTECESLGSIGDSGSLATSRDNVSLCSNSSFNEY